MKKVNNFFKKRRKKKRKKFLISKFNFLKGELVREKEEIKQKKAELRGTSVGE